MQEIFEKIKERVCEFIHERNKSGSAPCKNQRASCLQLIRVCDLTAIINQVAEEYGKESSIDYSEFSMENQVELFKAGIKPEYVRYSTYEQVAWERDIAIEQLHELGYEFGQKIDKEEFCEWIRDNDEFDVYDTKCRNRHVFFEGSPEDNEYVYCPYCGKKIKVVE